MIDVRDLAAWIVDSAESRQVGVFDGLGPPDHPGRLPDRDLRRRRRATTLTWVDQEFLESQGVAPWMGPRSVPLWLPLPEYDGLMTHDVDGVVRRGPAHPAVRGQRPGHARLAARASRRHRHRPVAGRGGGGAGGLAREQGLAFAHGHHRATDRRRPDPARARRGLVVLLGRAAGTRTGISRSTPRCCARPPRSSGVDEAVLSGEGMMHGRRVAVSWASSASWPGRSGWTPRTVW